MVAPVGHVSEKWHFPGLFGQDEGIGRYTLPAHRTKRRTTTNLKTKNNQNCQKIELYGSPTTKELKKKYSFRLVGGVGNGQPGQRERGKVGAGGLGGRGGRWQTEWSHICM